MSDLISRQAAIDALWKALYEYEDKTEKQFQESEDLDVGDWIEHRIFVQNMNDIDRQTILNLPSVQPKLIKAKIGHDPTVDETEILKKMLLNEPIVLLPSVQPEIIPLPSETPCDVCRHNPPSSMDGKPCCICPAEGGTDETD